MSQFGIFSMSYYHLPLHRTKQAHWRRAFQMNKSKKNLKRISKPLPFSCLIVSLTQHKSFLLAVLTLKTRNTVQKFYSKQCELHLSKCFLLFTPNIFWYRIHPPLLSLLSKDKENSLFLLSIWSLLRSNLWLSQDSVYLYAKAKLPSSRCTTLSCHGTGQRYAYTCILLI